MLILNLFFQQQISDLIELNLNLILFLINKIIITFSILFFLSSVRDYSDISVSSNSPVLALINTLATSKATLPFLNFKYLIF